VYELRNAIKGLVTLAHFILLLTLTPSIATVTQLRLTKLSRVDPNLLPQEQDK